MYKELRLEGAATDVGRSAGLCFASGEGVGMEAGGLIVPPRLQKPGKDPLVELVESGEDVDVVSDDDEHAINLEAS